MRPLRLALLFVVLGVLVVSTSLAYAEPPDPIWIQGIYDGADVDDAVCLITSAVGAIDPFPRDRVSSVMILAALLPQLEEGAGPSTAPSSIRPRAPPAR